jgi:protein phosphatase-4 regulatory subunit 3
MHSVVLCKLYVSDSIFLVTGITDLPEMPVMLNDHNMYEHILEDDIFSGVVGMLECASYSFFSTSLLTNSLTQMTPNSQPTKPTIANSSTGTSNFHQPIPIRDEANPKKIHHTYRLQFMKDVVLARALDDSTFNVLNSCIIFNQIDIINHVQHDVGFLREVVGLYVDDDMLSGGGVKKKDKEGKDVEVGRGDGCG